MKYFLVCAFLLSLKLVLGQSENQDQDMAEGFKISSRTKRVYGCWGYNRAWHSRSTMVWKTEKGEFVLHDTKAYDRPSPFDPAVYFNPGQISIPQFNARLGWESIRENYSLGIELGQDHMKWVLDNNGSYEITGEYRGDLYSMNSDGTTDLVTFEEVKANRDATPFAYEYSDGHNYVHASAFAYRKLMNHGIFSWDMGLDAGIGLYVPRPHAHLLDNQGIYQGSNGRFQVSGFGFHSSLRSRFYFWDRVFIESVLREVAIYNKNSRLYSPINFRVSHKGMMWSTEFYALMGVVIYKF